jgi:hypothetical protein
MGISMSESAKLLSKPTNYAVVQLPDRQFPGVVMQGDSLHALVRELGELLRLAEPYSNEELNMGLKDLHEQFQAVALHCERVCDDHGVELPYSR